MIKIYTFVICLFIFSSCTTINIESIKQVPKIINLKNNQPLPEIYEDKEFNYMIYTSKGKSYQTLKNVNDNNGVLEWIDKNEHTYLTLNGKLIRSYGTENDFNIMFNNDFTNKLYVDGTSIKTNIIFENPNSGSLDIYFTYKVLKSDFIKLKSSSKKIKINLVEEKFDVPKIFWRGANYYWINEEYGVIKSKQNIHPFKSKLHLETLKTVD